jgi:hypothetical protein
MILLLPLVFVYSGSRLPSYAKGALSLAVKFSGSQIFLLTDCENLSKVPSQVNVVKLESFYDQRNFGKFLQETTIEHEFRDGFWLRAVERFFILEQFMAKGRISEIFHAELDVLTFQLQELSEALNLHGKGIFIPRESQERAIASLIYVNDLEALNALCGFIDSNSHCSNEMEILAKFLDQEPQHAFALPSEAVFNLSESWLSVDVETTKGLVDAAALGQYLFGADPRNFSLETVKTGFINENWRANPQKINFSVPDRFGNLWIRYSGMRPVKTYALHVHSKIHRKLARHGVLASFIQSANRNKKRIISRNLMNKFRNRSGRTKEYIFNLLSS